MIDCTIPIADRNLHLSVRPQFWMPASQNNFPLVDNGFCFNFRAKSDLLLFITLQIPLLPLLRTLIELLSNNLVVQCSRLTSLAICNVDILFPSKRTFSSFSDDVKFCILPKVKFSDE